MGLLDFIKKNQDIRKIFGARELKVIEKQLLGVNLTQSERNRLSRDIRKKLETIKELSKFESEFKLKKGAKIKELVEETKETILDSEFSHKIEKIILFGSAVKNELTFRSDIDIAIIFKNKPTIKEATRFRIWASGKVNKKIDIQVFNILPKKVRESILKNYKTLYKNER